MLEVEEAPKDSYQGVQNGHSAIKGELRDLGCWQLSISVPEFDNGTVFVNVESFGEDTVVSSLFNGVVDGNRVVQVDGLCQDDLAG